MRARPRNRRQAFKNASQKALERVRASWKAEIAAYIILMLVGTGIFFSQASRVPTSTRESNDISFLINIAASFASVTLIFIVVRFFHADPQEKLQEKLELITSRMDSLLDNAQDKLFGSALSKTPEQLYKNAIKHLKSKSGNDIWTHIRIFAPIGVWIGSEEKNQWLKEVRKYLNKKSLNNPQPKLFAIFGLPPLEQQGIPRQWEDIKFDLRVMEETLRPFENCERVEIHYYMPLPASIGFGAILFRSEFESTASFAFASAPTASEDAVDFALTTDNPEAWSYLETWFDRRMFYQATANNILMDRNHKFQVMWPNLVNALEEAHFEKQRKAYISNKEEIIKLIIDEFNKHLKSSLRILVNDTSKSPIELTQTIAKILGDRRKQAKEYIFEYQVLIIVDNKSASIAQLADEYDTRLDIFRANGIEHLLDIRICEAKPTGLDIFIVEKRHLLFNIPSVSGTEFLHRAIVLRDQRDAAEALCDWFANLYGPATRMADWEDYKNYRAQHKWMPAKSV